MTNRAARGMLSPLRVETAAAAGLRAGVVPGFGVKSKLFLCLEFLGVSVKHRPNYPVQGVSTTDRKRPFSFKAGSRAMSVVNSTAAVELSTNFNGEPQTGTITLPKIIPEKVVSKQTTQAPQRQNTRHAALRAAGLDHPDTVEIAGRVYDLRKMPTQRRAYFERLARITTAPTAAIRLKCYECSGYNAIEAGACNCRDCALWVLRHNRDARKQEATAGELGRASDDVETGADEAENSAAEEE